jgi:hypothetical protein
MSCYLKFAHAIAQPDKSFAGLGYFLSPNPNKVKNVIAQY